MGSKRAIAKIEVKDVDGNWIGEATRDRPGEPWTIRYEDGEERFAGTQDQVWAKMKEHFDGNGVQARKPS